FYVGNIGSVDAILYSWTINIFTLLPGNKYAICTSGKKVKNSSVSSKNFAIYCTNTSKDNSCNFQGFVFSFPMGPLILLTITLLQLQILIIILIPIGSVGMTPNLGQRQAPHNGTLLA
ncbi:hypothetical protein ACJX0J_012387, partial [Zea mays]